MKASPLLEADRRTI